MDLRNIVREAKTFEEALKRLKSTGKVIERRLSWEKVECIINHYSPEEGYWAVVRFDGTEYIHPFLGPALVSIPKGFELPYYTIE